MTSPATEKPTEPNKPAQGTETKPGAPGDKSARKWEFHPIAEVFPLLDKDSHGFKALIEDIQANSQHQPVILYEDKILDGRNRYNACQHLGIDVRTRDYPGTDPIGFVLSVNLHRRHLNTRQRADVAAKLANYTHGGDRSKAPNGALTDAAAAKLLNVSERSVERAKALLKKGDPSDIESEDEGGTEAGANGGGSGSGTGSGGGSGSGSGTGGTGGAGSGVSASDKYDRAEAKLIERLKDLKPTEADTAAAETIKKLKATVETMRKAVASAKAA
jgi:hypothetical protein